MTGSCVRGSENALGLSYEAGELSLSGPAARVLKKCQEEPSRLNGGNRQEGRACGIVSRQGLHHVDYSILAENFNPISRERIKPQNYTL